MIIYKATNKINGKMYIGKSSLTLEERKKKHWKKSKSSQAHFHNALRKYGLDGFNWEVLCECSAEEVNNKETSYIAEYCSNDHSIGYNSTIGGDGGDTWSLNTHKEQTSKRLSESIRNSDMHKQRLKEVMGPFNRAKACNPEYRKNLSNALTGRKFTEEHKAALKESFKNRVMTDEHKKHIAEAMRLRMSDPEERKKISKALKGRTSHRKGKKLSAETREKMRLAHLGKKRVKKSATTAVKKLP